MGDYWTVSAGVANHTGHTCRECRGMICANAPIYVRDGRKIRLFYHEACYSGDSDPRTQARSSANERWGGISIQAPRGKGYGKWWTSSYGYSGGLPSIKWASVSSGVRDQNHKPADNSIAQRRVSLLARSSEDGSSSSKTYDESNRTLNTYAEGVDLRSMTPQEGVRDDFNSS